MFRPKILLALAAALAMTFGARSASADQFDLNLDHSSGSAVTVSPPLGTVTLTQISTGLNSEITIVFQANTSQIYGFHDVGFNYSGSSALTITATQVGATSNTFSQEGTNVQLDGLGTFSFVYGKHAAGPVPASEATTVTLDIKGANLTLAQFENLSTGGAPSVYFAAGMAYLSTINGGRTGWVGSTAAVPEPSSMAIAGLGVLGFLGHGLRRRLKK